MTTNIKTSELKKQIKGLVQYAVVVPPSTTASWNATPMDIQLKVQTDLARSMMTMGTTLAAASVRFNLSPTTVHTVQSTILQLDLFKSLVSGLVGCSMTLMILLTNKRVTEKHPMYSHLVPTLVTILTGLMDPTYLQSVGTEKGTSTSPKAICFILTRDLKELLARAVSYFSAFVQARINPPSLPRMNIAEVVDIFIKIYGTARQLSIAPDTIALLC